MHLTHADPLRIATQAQQMARAGGDESKAFQKVAICCMGAMAVASVVTALTPLLRATLQGVTGIDRGREDHGRRTR